MLFTNPVVYLQPTRNGLSSCYLTLFLTHLFLSLLSNLCLKRERWSLCGRGGKYIWQREQIKAKIRGIYEEMRVQWPQPPQKSWPQTVHYSWCWDTDRQLPSPFPIPSIHLACSHWFSLSPSFFLSGFKLPLAFLFGFSPRYVSLTMSIVHCALYIHRNLSAHSQQRIFTSRRTQYIFMSLLLWCI